MPSGQTSFLTCQSNTNPMIGTVTNSVVLEELRMTSFQAKTKLPVGT